jgi:hypothetical protein
MPPWSPRRTDILPTDIECHVQCSKVSNCRRSLFGAFGAIQAYITVHASRDTAFLPEREIRVYITDAERRVRREMNMAFPESDMELSEAHERRSRLWLVVPAVMGIALLAAAIGLWSRHGGAVFFDMVSAGIAYCF